MNYNEVVALVDKALAENKQGIRASIHGMYPFEFLAVNMRKRGYIVELIKRYKDDTHDVAIYFRKEI